MNSRRIWVGHTKHTKHDGCAQTTKSHSTGDRDGNPRPSARCGGKGQGKGMKAEVAEGNVPHDRIGVILETYFCIGGGHVQSK